MSIKFHYYMFLSNSPWAVFSSLSFMNFFFSMYLFFKVGFFYTFFLSIILAFLISYMWWRDYTREFMTCGEFSDFIDFCVKFSMVFFIGSEVFFFFSFFWSYFHFFSSPVFDHGLYWPPFCVMGFSSFNVPLLNTIFLLSSGVTVTAAHFFLMGGKYKSSIFYVAFTVLLGLVFTFFQYEEYNNSFFCLSDSNFGSIFFMLTGFHGIHVIVGTIFLLVSFYRMLSFFFTSEHNLGFEICSWYWHFVDVVWIFLYFFLYYLVY